MYIRFSEILDAIEDMKPTTRVVYKKDRTTYRRNSEAVVGDLVLMEVMGRVQHQEPSPRWVSLIVHPKEKRDTLHTFTDRLLKFGVRYGYSDLWQDLIEMQDTHGLTLDEFNELIQLPTPDQEDLEEYTTLRLPVAQLQWLLDRPMEQRRSISPHWLKEIKAHKLKGEVFDKVLASHRLKEKKEPLTRFRGETPIQHIVRLYGEIQHWYQAAQDTPLTNPHKDKIEAEYGRRYKKLRRRLRAWREDHPPTYWSKSVEQIKAQAQAQAQAPMVDIPGLFDFS